MWMCVYVLVRVGAYETTDWFKLDPPQTPLLSIGFENTHAYVQGRVVGHLRLLGLDDRVHDERPKAAKD